MHLFKNKLRRTTGAKKTTSSPGRSFLSSHRGLIVRSVLIFIGIGLMCSLFMLFDKHYWKNPRVFNLGNIRKNVTIETGKTIRPDMIYPWVGLKNGIASFDINIAETYHKFAGTPNAKEVEIIRTLPDKLYIRIKERDPLARLSSGPRGLVVDDEGVAFVQHSSNAVLPLIRLSEEFDQIQPNDRLSGMELNAINVLQQASKSGFKLRIAEIDARNNDYLLLIFSDYRKAKFAWQGMKNNKLPPEESNERLKSQLMKLGQAMESEIGRPRQMWDATVPGRVTAKSITN